MTAITLSSAQICINETHTDHGLTHNISMCSYFALHNDFHGKMFKKPFFSVGTTTEIFSTTGRISLFQIKAG